MIVCRMNLPDAAQQVYRDPFNRAWRDAAADESRHLLAQTQAWSEVRERFERDDLSAHWIPRAAVLEPRVVTKKRAVAKKRSAR